MTAENISSSAQDDAELDPNSLAAIRDLLASEKPVTPKPVRERIAEKAAVAQAPAEPVQLEPIAASQHTATAPHAAAVQPAQDKPKRWGRKARPAKAKASAPVADGQSAGLIAKIKGYRPTFKHILIAAAVLLVLFRPWLVFGLLFLGLFIITGIFLILGYDGFWHRIMGVARWYARRHPTRSAEVHRKLDSFAMRFDAFLDRFPEGSVDGLYLPDFGDLAEAEARHDEALDRRFETLRESGA